MDVDGALVDVDVSPPHAIEQLAAVEYTAGTLHQEFEQTELGRPEMDVAPAARNPPAVTVELQIPGSEHVRHPLGFDAPQQRANTCNELGGREWFDDIVVSARHQPAHPLALLAAGGEYDDRQPLGVGARAQASAQFDPG